MTPCSVCGRASFGRDGLCTNHRAARQIVGGKIGMEAAVDHADRDTEGWRQIAGDYLDRFAAAHAGHYLAEDVAPWAAIQGCPPPPDQRAWGAVIKDGGKRGIIEQTGLAAKNKLSGNASTWRPLWRTKPVSA